MLTQQWTKQRITQGKYHVALQTIGQSGTTRIPGMILGGNGRWLVQLAGNQWPEVYRTINAAAAALVRHHHGI